jgi:sulfur-oxidizing protein SoxY
MPATRRQLSRNSNGSKRMTFSSTSDRGVRSMMGFGVRTACAAALAAVLGCGAALAAEPVDPWPELARDIFNGRQLADGAGLIAIDMPYRAEDAAIVPVTLRATLPPGDTRTVKAITLVVDENPAPVAATFQVGAGVTMISTRVRVDSYTNVHAVAELSDGKFYVSKTFVKASGGCSAPTTKNAEQANANLGQMRFRQFAKPSDGPAGGPHEAQIMIRHPNNSGLQRDQVTLLYVPAFFIKELRVRQGDELVLAMDGGISISENQYPVQLSAERRRHLPGRGDRHRRPCIHKRVAGRARNVIVRRCDRQKQRTSASAWARRSSSTATFAYSVERNWLPSVPGTCTMLSTVSAVT